MGRVFALVGNPNSGKTTLFNRLTGLRQKVGNYAGVTVERKEGTVFSQHGRPMTLIDLPGAYSLSAHSPDERVMQDVLLGRRREERRADGVVCVVDASNLERNLFLVSQLTESGMPVVVVLNMMDAAEGMGLKIDVERLGEILGVPVIATSAAKGTGMANLRVALSRSDLPVGKRLVEHIPSVEKALEAIGKAIPDREGDEARTEALLYLTDGRVPDDADVALRRLVESKRVELDRDHPGWRSDTVARRYARISDWCREVVHKVDPGKPSWTARVDAVLLHPVLGFLVLGLVMGFLFFSIFKLSGPPMDWIDGLMVALGGLVEAGMSEGDLRSLLVDGVIGGVGGVVIFLPQILMLFLFIGILESTGYMARAAFILDRVMSKVGLHGRSFIPLLSSYACAVPGIMATRTIESARDRLVTILVAPFMSCSARLPVYLLMLATLLPEGEHPAWVKSLFLLLFYSMGTVAAFFFALLFKKTVLRGETPNLIMELPPYRLPRMKHVLWEMADRVWAFLRRAGTVIFGLSIILWFLVSFPKPSEELGETALEASFAGQMGRMVEPVFDPLGYDWRINIGIISSFAAREVFVSTMAIIYRVGEESEAAEENLVEVMRSQTRADGRPLFTPLTCMSIIVFFVFALQCISTVAVVRRETNSWVWPAFQLVFMTGVAYLAALMVYRGGLLLGFS